jgi:hypothetical protein
MILFDSTSPLNKEFPKGAEEFPRGSIIHPKSNTFMQVANKSPNTCDINIL